MFCMHVATLPSSIFMTLHCITWADETMVFCLSTALTEEPINYSYFTCKAFLYYFYQAQYLSIKSFVVKKFYILNINWVKNWFHVFRLKRVSIKSKFRWQSSQNPCTLQALRTTQWRLSNPTTISTSLPKKLRGTDSWVHHTELNNAPSKAVAALGQSSEIVL